MRAGHGDTFNGWLALMGLEVRFVGAFPTRLKILGP
jgi:hypothetical protein